MALSAFFCIFATDNYRVLTKNRLNMKKLLLFLAMLMPMAASAYDFMVDGVAYNILSAADLTCVVTE